MHVQDSNTDTARQTIKPSIHPLMNRHACHTAHGWVGGRWVGVSLVGHLTVPRATAIPLPATAPQSPPSPSPPPACLHHVLPLSPMHVSLPVCLSACLPVCLSAHVCSCLLRRSAALWVDGAAQHYRKKRPPPTQHNTQHTVCIGERLCIDGNSRLRAGMGVGEPRLLSQSMRLVRPLQGAGRFKGTETLRNQKP